MQQQHICVIGLGYIGLPTAALAAQAGHRVTGVDVQVSVVETVNSGKTHLVEPGLPEVVAATVQSGALTAQATIPNDADIYLICVPTPFDHATKKPDMKYVRTAAEQLAQVVPNGALVVLESTSTIGATTEHVQNVMEQANPALVGKLDYIFCPERAIPGDTMRELVENDRLVGGLTSAAAERGVAFYKTFVTGDISPTDATTAELVKLVENASRDAQLAFVNSLSMVCDKLGTDVWDVIAFANRHPRVNLLQPGPGVGGHCLPVDPWFIVDAAPEHAQFIQAAREANVAKELWVVEKIKQALATNPNASVALFGLAYKPNVDDFRESPSVSVAQKVKQALPQTNLLVVEPFMKESTEWQLSTMDAALNEADIVVVLTDHEQFNQVTSAQLAGKTVIDTRGQFRNQLNELEQQKAA